MDLPATRLPPPPPNPFQFHPQHTPTFSSSSSSATATATSFFNGTPVVAEAAAPPPVPLVFVAKSGSIKDDLIKDNHGVVRDYPEPLEEALKGLHDVMNYVEEGLHRPIHFKVPTCRLTTSNSTTDSPDAPRQGNCTEACADPRLLFEPINFASCIQLATASLYIEDRRAEMNKNDAGTVSATQQLVVSTDLSDFNGTKVIGDMIKCAIGGCRTSGKGMCSDEIFGLMNKTVDSQAVRDIGTRMDTYCANSGSIVNEDVAGPGILMSYILQTGLALIFWILAKFFTTFLRPGFWAVYKIRQETRDTAWKQAGLRQERLALTRGSAAVICSMIEFQEIQGFFVAAVQVATLLTYGTDWGNELTGVDSFGMLVFNSGLVQVLAVSGVLPVLLVQVSLQRAGMRWWYTMAIAIMVVFLGIIVDNRGGFMLPKFETVYEHFREKAGVPECGGNPSPLVYCTPETPFALTDDFGQNIAYFVLPMMLIDQIGLDLWRRYALERKVRRWERSRPLFRSFRRRIFPRLWRIVWIVLQMLLLCFTLIYLFNIFQLVDKATLLGKNRWSYGQLVAVMVWAPILGKYLYFNIFGIEAGFGRRLAKHYRVVHQVEPSDDEYDDDDTTIGGSGRHQVMEQGIELKVSPVTSSTTLPQGGAPTAMSPSNPSSATTSPTLGPPISAFGSMPQQPPQQQHSYQQRSFSPPPPFHQESQDEGITMAGGVPIAIENHDNRADLGR